MSSPGIAVLARVQRHRELADRMEEYAPDQARLMRRLAEEYEEDVRTHAPEWWTLPAVQAAKPWSMKSLRRKARALIGQDKARKNGAGHWELRWDAVLELPEPPVRVEPVEVEDLEATAAELAGEE